MSQMIFCTKLQKEAEGLESAPYPGPLGEKILNEISREAWQNWLSHQTMLINENHLSLAEPKARTFLKEQMEAYLFGEGSETPQGYTPPQK